MKEIFFISFHNFINNKKQSLATIVAVALTSMLLFSVCIIFSTYKKYQLDSAINSLGTVHVIINSNINELVLLKKDENIDKIHTFVELNSIHYDSLRNEEDFNLSIMSADFNYENLINMMVGDYPTSENEIIISDYFATLADYDLGDYILGYEIVGIYSKVSFRYSEYRDTLNLGSVYAPIAFTKKNLPSEGSRAIFLVNYKSYKNIYNKIDKTVNELGLEKNDYTIHKSLLAAHGMYQNKDDSERIYLFLITFLMIISIFCFMIVYNSFAITSANRQKNYGILRSVGASKKHIFWIVMSEAFLVALIAIPLGYILSISIINLVILIINNTLASIILPIIMTVKPSFILIGIVFSLVVILLSAVKSAYKACQIPPVHATKNYQKMKVKKIKEDYHIINKLLGEVGELAIKNALRIKSNFIYPLLTLTLCLILFISVSAFINYAIINVNYSDLRNADIVVDINEEDISKIDNIEKAIKNLKGIDKIVMIKSLAVFYNSSDGTAGMIPLIAIDNDSFKDYQKGADTNSKYIVYNKQITGASNNNYQVSNLFSPDTTGITLCDLNKNNPQKCNEEYLTINDFTLVSLNYLNLIYSASIIVSYDTFNSLYDDIINKIIV